MEQKILSLLIEIKDAITSNKMMLTVPEAAAHLGISKTFLYQLTAARKLPYSKPGKHIYFRKADLISYMQQNPVASIEELDQKALAILNKKEIRS